MGDHGEYENVYLFNLMEERGIEPNWLPAYSIEFLQALDTAVFGSFKQHYSNLRTELIKPKLQGKLLRVLHT
jgi:hypothetical protein